VGGGWEAGRWRGGALGVAVARVGVAAVPQVVQGRIRAALPGPLFGLLVDTLQHGGKVFEEAGVIVGVVAVLAVLGGGAGALARRRSGAGRSDCPTSSARWVSANPTSPRIASPIGARAASAGEESHTAVVRPPGTFGVRLTARITCCGPPRAALIVLEQAPTEPRPRAVAGDAVELVGAGKSVHGRQLPLPHDCLQSVDAVHAWHFEVKRDYTGRQVLDLFQRKMPVYGSSNDLDGFVLFENSGNQLPHQRRVVHH